MCRFFTTKNIATGLGAATVLFPIAMMIHSFSNEDISSGIVCAGWFLSSCASIGAGYYFKAEKKCQLPHLAENVVVEERPEVEAPQIEGEGEEVEMAAPEDLAPNFRR